MKYTYTVRYTNKECEQVVMEFQTKAEAVAKAEYLTNQFDYNVAVCKELLGECVEMTMFWAK